MRDRDLSPFDEQVALTAQNLTELEPLGLARLLLVVLLDIVIGKRRPALASLLDERNDNLSGSSESTAKRRAVEPVSSVNVVRGNRISRPQWCFHDVLLDVQKPNRDWQDIDYRINLAKKEAEQLLKDRESFLELSSPSMV